MKTWDAIVVGSGITGGWAAKKLTEGGLETLLLDAGPPVDPAKDFTEHVPPWEMPLRGLGVERKILDEQPIQRRCEAHSEYNARFFVSDRDHPYSTPSDRPYWWIRGRQVGGRSLTWGRKTYRWSDDDFTANARESIGTPWPIGYADLAPFYDEVESFIGVSGQAEGLAQLPDGKFLPPMALSCGERLMRDRIAKAFGGERIVTPARSAVLTRDHGGRPACHYCGPCDRGCSTGSYFSTASSTLPAARATGKLTLRANAIARRLLFDPKRGRLSGVAVLDAGTGRDEELSARLVFLCASTLESVRLLLNSADTRFPGGLANSSGTLGRNLMDHLCAGGASGTLPELAKYRDPGRRPSGVYVPRWVNRATKEKDFLRGFGFQGESRRLGVGSLFQRPRLGPVGIPGFGAPLKEALSAGGSWSVSLSGFGECLPHPDNRATIDPALKDRFGIPSLAISAGWGANERAMWPRMRAAAAELLEAAGVKDAALFGPDAPDVPGRAVHEMGGARMGDDPKTSVLDRWNRAHDVPNLFVTDGSCMASSGCVNPSLTYMAITARAASFAIEALKRRDL